MVAGTLGDVVQQIMDCMRRIDAFRPQMIDWDKD